MRPALLMTESIGAIFTTKEHPEYIAALAKRGITDLDDVQIDPWPAGIFGYECEEGRRITRCISFLRDRQDRQRLRAADRRADRPLRHGGNEVIEVIDHGVTPLPPNRASYYAERSARACARAQADLDHAARGSELHGRRQPRRVAEVAVPDRLRSRTKGSCCTRSPTTMTAASVRSCTARRSPRWWCPTATRAELHGWKNAFDAGEWGLGRMTQPLTLGCDCLGEIHYFDATLANEQGKPWVIPNAICMHEEDYGILWKHVDLHRRPDRGAPQPATRGQLRRHGRQLRVRLLLVLLSRRQHSARGEADRASSRRWRSSRARNPTFANVIADGVAAPHHQHMFNARLDFDVDGAGERGATRWRPSAMPAGPDNPWLQRVPPACDAARHRARRLARNVDAAHSRTWRIANPDVRNGLGQPTAYKLVPTMSTPTLLAHPESPIGRRAGFAQHNLWVTPLRARRATRGAASTRTSTPAATASRAGPRKTATSPTPTWSSGTRSGSHISCGPKTGRSCRWSTPASRSCRSGSSIAIPRSTCQPSDAHCHAEAWSD